MPTMLNRVGLFLIILLMTLCPIRLTAQNGPEIKLKCVVIDAGHGGHDPGAVSPDKKLQEKSINLDVALKLGKLISEKYPDIKVIYTRSTDVFISLNERTNIANRNHADLFISIHVNSVGGKSSANGTEVFVMGTDKNSSNMEVSKRENSVILLEDDYSTTYQGFDPNVPESYIFFNLMQNAFFEQSIEMATCVDNALKTGPIVKSRGVKQGPLLVLWRTTMPSVLIEIGFISSSADRKYLSDASSRSQIADKIFSAFENFKGQYETGVNSNAISATSTPVEKSTEQRVETKVVEKVEDEISKEEKVEEKIDPPSLNTEKKTVYKIQILASKKHVSLNAPDFKGTKGIDELFLNGFYKYCIGEFSSKEEASKELKNIKKTFPQAFIISVDNSVE